PWVRKIIVNRCYDFLRREQTRAKYRDENRESELYKSADSEAPDLELRLAESEETLRIITSMLSPKQRIVFILSEIDEMSVKEIKDITGMTSNSIKSNCYHARKRAREIFELLDKR
ncbi:MAG: RNA polymerase sigma factor, partial [Bacteroidia bacterium]